MRAATERSSDRLALGVAYALAGSEVVHIVLLCYSLGWRNGLLAAANDPGKVLFHLLLLPLAMAVLIQRFPRERARLFLRSTQRRATAIVAASMLLAVSAWFVVDGAQDDYQRWPMPQDFGMAVPIPDAVLNESNVRAAPAEAKTTTPRALDVLATALRAQVMQKAISADDAQKSYKLLLPAPRSMWKDGGLVQLWCVMLSLVGAWGVCAFMATIGVFLVAPPHPQRGRTPTDDEWEGLLVVLALLTSWLVLRAYSEWYLHLGNLDLKQYPPFLVGLVTALLVGALIWKLKVRRTAVAAVAGLFAAVSATIGVFSKLKPEWFDWAAGWFAELRASGLAVVYVVIFFSFLCLVLSIQDPADEPGAPA